MVGWGVEGQLESCAGRHNHTKRNHLLRVVALIPVEQAICCLATKILSGGRSCGVKVTAGLLRLERGSSNGKQPPYEFYKHVHGHIAAEDSVCITIDTSTLKIPHWCI